MDNKNYPGVPQSPFIVVSYGIRWPRQAGLGSVFTPILYSESFIFETFPSQFRHERRF